MKETVLRAGDGTWMMINWFTVDPDRQVELAEVLGEGADKFIRHFPGCLSVNIATSRDRTRLLYIAQWEKKSDIKAAMADPDINVYRLRAAGIATPDAHAFQLHSTHHPD